MNQLLRTPGHVHVSVAKHGGGVVLNLRSGKWYALNTSATLMWEELCRTGDVDAAVRAVAAEYPAARETRIRSDVSELVSALTDRRLVVVDRPGEGRSPSARSPTELSATHVKADTAVVVEGRAAAGGRRSRTGFALALALVSLKMPFRWSVWLVSKLRARADTEASVSEAVEVLLAVERAARHYPGRVACLEQSLTAVLAAALAGRRLDWVIGIAEDPYRFHAWAETCGVPILPAAEPAFADYSRLLKV
jgi:hypothetical protein